MSEGVATKWHKERTLFMSKARACGECHACSAVNYGVPGEVGRKVKDTIDRLGDKYAYALGGVLCEVYSDTDLSVEWVLSIINLWIRDGQKYSRNGHIEAVSEYLRKQVAVNKKTELVIMD